MQLGNRRCPALGGSLFVFFFVLILNIFLIIVIVIFGHILFVFLFFYVIVVRNDIHMHGMSLRDFHLGLAFRAAQDLSLFHFVFIHIEFGSTIRAADHGHFLRSEF